MLAPECGGIDAKFVEGICEEYRCPICYLALRDPVQTVNCGHRFCRLCIDRVMGRAFSICPLDRSKLLRKNIFPDLAAKRAIDGLKVNCNNVVRGCGWSGELRNLQRHVDECEWEEVRCSSPQCKAKVPRAELAQHTENECLWRTTKCQHCADTYLVQEEQKHLDVCKQCLIDCPNCGVRRKRAKMLNHMNDDCELAIIPCTYEDIGCTHKAKRQKLQYHMRFSTVAHLNMALQRIRQLEQPCDGTLIWEINDFTRKFKQRDILSRYDSPSFYTSPMGYHFHVQLRLNGSKEFLGRAIAVFVHKEKGKYDSIVKWPFSPSYSVTLLDQNPDYDQRKNHSCENGGHVSFTQDINKGNGWACFISHEDFNARSFIKDDRIFLKVVVTP